MFSLLRILGPKEYFGFYFDLCTSANAALEISFLKSRAEQNERGGECGQMHSRVYQ